MGTIMLKAVPQEEHPIPVFIMGLAMSICAIACLAILIYLSFRYLFIDPGHRRKHGNIKTIAVTILFLANCWGLGTRTTGHVSSDIYLGLATPTHIEQILIDATESL